MDLRVLNVCLLLGWLMVTAGGVIVNVGWGIAMGGLLLIVLTVAMALIGGVFAPKAKPDERPNGSESA